MDTGSRKSRKFFLCFALPCQDSLELCPRKESNCTRISSVTTNSQHQRRTNYLKVSPKAYEPSRPAQRLKFRKSSFFYPAVTFLCFVKSKVLDFVFTLLQVALGTPGSNVTQGIAAMSLNPAMTTGEALCATAANQEIEMRSPLSLCKLMGHLCFQGLPRSP